ncbi:MAG: hypothetical protein ACFCUT_03200 [Kiloniellaceae bacterium]
MSSTTRGLTLKLLLGFLGLWLAVMAIALPLAALPESAGGRVLAVFPPTLGADARLLAIAEADGRPVMSFLDGLVWLTEPADDRSGAPGFVGRLKAAGAWAAYHPDSFAVLPQGGCFYISVHPPGPPQPHPPI